MEINYETVSAWFDKYFETVAKTSEIESIPGFARFFTEDFEYTYYTMPPVDVLSEKADREGILKSFMHPGIHELIRPEYYLMDLKKLIVAVRLYDQIVSDTAGVIAKFNGCAIYFMVPAEDMGIKIRKIEFFTENQSPESIEIQNKEYAKSTPVAFNKLFSDWLKLKGEIDSNI
jgi:hypothetical protein